MNDVMSVVSSARKTDRINMKDITSMMIDDFIELHGDRVLKTTQLSWVGSEN